ncbi:hypothetical protein FACUT_8056 [Fusarium acutatum]|uniref:Uncharacterized protein n=1 Tax=Fusarium acutatum TaxID=78861 RepID=A0A8H4JLG0_9HYPO|nr:hypothetical protein FACUT_8056 [Fusarium acutatum]
MPSLKDYRSSSLGWLYTSEYSYIACHFMCSIERIDHTTYSGVKFRPSWYYRVHGLLLDRYGHGETDLCDENADLRPEDFDEDLSEIIDVECRDSDNELDRNDPFDIEYLEMKLDRRDRKTELQAQKKWEAEMRKKSEKYRQQINEKLREEKRKEAQKIKVHEDAEMAGDAWRQHKNKLRPWKTYEEVATEDDIGLEVRHVDEIQDTLDRAQSLEETPTPLDLGLMRMFKLWSIDHIKHCPYELALTIYIEFSSWFDWGKFNEEQIRTLRAKKLPGHIYLLSETVCDLDNFTPPEYCSTKTHNLGTSQEPVYIQFSNDNYLTLKISRETVFTNCEEHIPWSAPSLFTYYGISGRYMVDKEKQEEEQWETEEDSVIE